MKIQFTASVMQRELYGENYLKIIDTLERMGHTVRHEHITVPSLEFIFAQTPQERKDHYRKTMAEISSAQLVVAELSFPSTINVGHEITLALEKGKPVIGLYAQGRESAFFEGIQSDRFIYEEYTPETIPQVVEQAVHFAEQQSDSRFNFFISPKYMTFLDEVSRERKIPKSVYLRELIERDMAGNTAYLEE